MANESGVQPANPYEAPNEVPEPRRTRAEIGLLFLLFCLIGFVIGVIGMIFSGAVVFMFWHDVGKF